ncbi:hypothetical protein [Pseudoalteromonas rubra]|uniref:Uncharacterized protein n=1 Tax=Pseudoalteromonas rubra TaxID=43658 RepID=A0A5S3WXG3_9GAMM|nr:hypothetical protein [Pseudoalteromonas rubra]TMP35976.1 hypothetical protein CWB98_14590 [Pseudoalteromonas rubra]
MKIWTRVFAALLLSGSAQVNAESRSGYVYRLYADPTDVVIVLKDNNKVNVNGECGSNFYHISRSAVNFSEFYSLVLSAAAARKLVYLEVGSCSGQRNILTHGSVQFSD